MPCCRLVLQFWYLASLMVNFCPPKSNTKLRSCSLYVSPAPQILLADPCPVTSQSWSPHISTDGALSQPQSTEPGEGGAWEGLMMGSTHNTYSDVYSYYVIQQL